MGNIKTIVERGNGFPKTGAYVPGDDGNLYRVVAGPFGFIDTSHPSGNAIRCEVEEADWDDCEERDQFQALVEV